MKAKWILMLAFLGVLTGCCGVGRYYFPNPPPRGCHSCETYTTCDCADPACRCGFGNPCLDRAICCDAFGNIGSSHFSKLTIDHPHRVYATAFRVNHHRPCYKGG